MSAPRTLISDFTLANALLADASISVFTVDPDTLTATTTLATLYDAPYGSGTLANPQSLDGTGKWVSPPYVDQPVVVRYGSSTVPSQETGIIGGIGRFRSDWTAGTVYSAGDVVIDGVDGEDTQNLYYCAAAHTAGAAFGTDLAAGLWIVYLQITAVAQEAADLVPSLLPSVYATAFGATGAGNPTDDSAAVAAACADAVRKGVRFVFFPRGAAGDYYCPSLTGEQCAAVIFIGDGARLSGVTFRKQIVDHRAPTPRAPEQTIIPARHLVNAAIQAQVGTVKVVIAGDSMSQFTSSGVGAYPSISAYLQRHLKNCNPGVTFDVAVQGVNGATFPHVLANQSSATWWPAGYGGGTWLNGITTVTVPHLVFLVFTSNDAFAGFNVANFLSVVSGLTAAGADVVFCLDVPKSIVNYSDAQNTLQEQVAGFIRTYALYHGHGFIDCNRRGSLVRDGSDPVNTTIYTPATNNPTNNQALPYTVATTIDYGLLWYEFGTAGANALTTAGDLSFQLGADSGNRFWIGRNSGTGKLRYKIDTDASNALVAWTDSTYDCIYNASGQAYFGFYVKDNEVRFFFGTSEQTVYAGPVIRKGGAFAPVIRSTTTYSMYFSILSTTDFTRRFLPQLTDKEVWGPSGYSPVPGYGGNYGVHPTALLGDYIYEPAVKAQDLSLPASAARKKGTWTPALRFGGAAVGMTYSGTPTGTYEVVGNLVYITVDFTLTAKGSSTGTATIVGVPYNAISGQVSLPRPHYFPNFSGVSAGAPILYIGSGSVVLVDTPGTVALTEASFTNGSALRFAGVYPRS